MFLPNSLRSPPRLARGSSGTTTTLRSRRRGFTLLELMLALSLTVVILLLVNMATDVHLRSLNSRRSQLEESQLARSVLRMIADDLRGVVLHYEQDTSGIESLLQQSVASAAGSVGQAAGSALGGAVGGQSAGGQSGGSATGAPSSGGGSGGGSSGGGSSSGGSSGGGSAMGSSGGVSASETASDEPTANTADLAATTIPPTPGLFGNQYQLQVDVSHLPRLEDYQRYLTPDAATGVVDIPSDVKTVTYYVKSTATLDAAAGTSTLQSLEDLSDPEANTTGLVRRELDRSVTLWAMNNGNYAGLENSGDTIAPEVAAIEFQYFDGTQWLLQWDTEAQQKLPIAVLVILALRAPGTTAAPDVALSDIPAGEVSDLHLYRMVVYLPNGGQPLATGSSGSSDSAESSGDGAMSSGTSGASSTNQAGGIQGGSGGGPGGGDRRPGGGGPGGGGPGGGGQGGGGQGGGRPGGGAPGGGGPGGGGPGAGNQGGGRPGGGGTGGGGPGGGGPGGGGQGGTGQRGGR